jgi:membrane-associated protease RseP (regulator of RpoE activity)
MSGWRAEKIPEEAEKLLKELEKYFRIYSYEVGDRFYRFYVIPFAEHSEIKRFLAGLSRDYEISMKYSYGELILELKKAEKRERIWINILLFIATMASTTAIGSTFYGERIDLVGGFIFSLAIMFVLGSHEMGHFLAARKWKMKTSLPYFIPFPTIVGTLGAVIRHRGAIPNRKALFDVGVAGPFTGIAASIAVTIIGLSLPFNVQGRPTLYIGTPPIFEALLTLMNYNSFTIHPVAFAGWVGFFVTFLNMIPVGQLDGGHVLRAMIGKNAEKVSKAMPLVLISIGIFISRVYNYPDSIWLLWGIIAFFFSMQGHPEPLDDITPLDARRYALGIIAFTIAVLCFTPVPFYAYTP